MPRKKNKILGLLQSTGSFNSEPTDPKELRRAVEQTLAPHRQSLKVLVDALDHLLPNERQQVENAPTAFVSSIVRSAGRAAGSRGGKTRAAKASKPLQPHWEAWEQALTLSATQAVQNGDYSAGRWRRHSKRRLIEQAIEWLKVHNNEALKATSSFPPKPIINKVLEIVTKSK